MGRLIDADALMRNVSLTKTLTPKDALADAIFDVVATLIDSAPTVEPQPQWISVKDRLPEYSYKNGAKAYWVAYDTRHGKEMQLALYCDYMYATVTALPECATWRDWESHKINNVTHWMELPALPKEDDNDA